MSNRKNMGIREAKRLAISSAAGIIESCDLGQLYGDASYSEDDEDVLTRAQKELVEFLHKKAGRS
jgi:hypothetical protein